MKNYLKKAISAVIALALSASIVPATFAANVALTDVPETADYATAVNTLVALKVIDGYTDNTFKPDNLITRAEASKVIVAALNEIASAEAMKGATKFSDIEAKHEWATGYINKGVSMGYINGMENNQFQPDGNVTYAQIIKMMLCAMGYEDYAASLAEQYDYTGANWYIPFTQLAADAGVTDGVYANPNEAVTRAQVAQLVYNAIKAPIVKNVGVNYTDSGKIVPRIQVQDGVELSVYYRSILTEKFDAYFVEGYVSGTQKDGTGLKADEVDFAIAKSKKYAEEDVRFTDTINDYTTVTGTPGRTLTKVKVGDTDAADYKGTYATVIIMLDDYDDWNILHFTPSGKNKSVKFDLKDLDTDEYYKTSSTSMTKADWDAIKNTATPYLKFFDEGASVSTKYILAANATPTANVDLYVNGKIVADADAIWNYVINGDIGDVELVDTYKTDGKIDTIYVNSYVSGQVDGISSTGKITLDGADHGIYSMLLDDDDAQLEYHIYYNGEEITINDLKEDDVLSIAYDVTLNASQKTSFAQSKFYEIYVSRDVVTDTLKGKNTDEKTAKFGDTYYDFGSSSKFSTFNGTAKLGDEYTLYLDAFGRIFKAEINSSAANWGIAEKFAINTGAGDDEYKLTVFTADGSTKAYYFDAAKATVEIVDGSNAVTNTYNKGANPNGNTESGLNTTVMDNVYVTAAEEAADALANGGTATIHEGDKEAIEDRVIQYKVASSGKITELKFIANGLNTLGGSGGKEEFKTRNNTIGSIKLGDATKLIDATKYAEKDLFAVTVGDLTDEVAYKAYAYGKKIDGLYPFVLVTDGEAKYNAKTRFAVITEAGYAEEEDETGDTIYSIKAMYGDETELIVSDDVSTSALNALTVGNVIYFTTNAKGYIKDFDVIFSVGTQTYDGASWNYEAANIPAYADLVSASVVASNETYTNLHAAYPGAPATDDVVAAISVRSSFPSTDFSSDFETAWTASTADSIQLIYGPVIERTDADVTFASIDGSMDTDTLNASEAVVFDLAEDVNVYTYDYAMGKDWRFGYSTAASAIVPSNILDSNLDSDQKTISWDKTVDGVKVNQEAVNFAFAVVVEDEIVDIFTFMAR